MSGPDFLVLYALLAMLGVLASGLRRSYLLGWPITASDKPLSFGPIHKVWWAGTEAIVQARRGGWH